MLFYKNFKKELTHKISNLIENQLQTLNMKNLQLIKLKDPSRHSFCSFCIKCPNSQRIYNNKIMLGWIKIKY